MKGVCIQRPRGSRVRPTGSQGVKALDKGYACRFLEDQGVGLQGHRGSGGRPTGSQEVKE